MLGKHRHFVLTKMQGEIKAGEFMNTNEGNYCPRESEEISQVLETFKVGL